AAGNGRRDLGDVTHLPGQVGRHQVDVVGEVLPGTRDALDFGLAAELALGADLVRHVRYFRGERVELVHHRVDGVLQLENLAFDVDDDLLRQIATRHGSGHLGDVAHLTRQVGGHQVDVVGKVFPRTSHAFDLGLAAELALGADLARHARHFRGEGVELIDHRIDRVLQLENLTPHVDGDLLGEVATGNGRRDFGNIADLAGQVRRHQVDVVGEVFPGAGDTLH